jgi:hypothetical protein
MRFSRKSLVTVLLALFALICSIVTAYIFSIQWWGGWRYPELIAPICGSTVAGVLAIAVMAAIGGRQREGAKTLRAILMMGACYMATAGLSFAVLANCSVSCGERTIEAVQSPSRLWRAIWTSQDCTAIARYCPSISKVTILRSGEATSNSQEVFSIAEADGLQLEWKSDNLLLISYMAGMRILRKDNRAGVVQNKYLPIGWM